MNPPPAPPDFATGAATAARAPSPEQTLRRLFLILFLRGRSSRGMRKETAPKSIGRSLWLTLLVYGCTGLLALFLLGQPVFTFSLYLHAMTMAFLSMFVAASAGEILFNKEEADILLHRPVTSRALLWGKVSVLVVVSLWLAGAFNLPALLAEPLVGKSWQFSLAHILSTAFEALFCAATVVVAYQLCLRWVGRARLDTLMTTAQVLVAALTVLGSQLVPRAMGRWGGKLDDAAHAWWIRLLPPAWFAGIDDALAGRAMAGAWALAAVAVLATAAAVGLAFGKLARDYEVGLQTMQETAVSKPRPPDRRRWLDVLLHAPPLKWWLGDPVTRAAFLLTTAYLVRDRDVKLRIYPGLAPLLVMPLMFLIEFRGETGSGFGLLFAGGYLGVIPLLGLTLIRYSQQWQAADLFRLAPMAGPASLCHGARGAILFVLTLPVIAVFALLVCVLQVKRAQLPLLLPGLLAIPIYAIIPCLRGGAVPLSTPVEEAKSARRGLLVMFVTFASCAFSGIAAWAWSTGWFRWLLLGEVILVAAGYTAMRMIVSRARWRPPED